jgi:hypothetical protein
MLELSSARFRAESSYEKVDTDESDALGFELHGRAAA